MSEARERWAVAMDESFLDEDELADTQPVQNWWVPTGVDQRRGEQPVDGCSRRIPVDAAWEEAAYPASPQRSESQGNNRPG